MVASAELAYFYKKKKSSSCEKKRDDRGVKPAEITDRKITMQSEFMQPEFVFVVACLIRFTTGFTSAACLHPQSWPVSTKKNIQYLLATGVTPTEITDRKRIMQPEFVLVVACLIRFTPYLAAAAAVTSPPPAPRQWTDTAFSTGAQNNRERETGRCFSVGYDRTINRVQLRYL